MPLKGHPLCGIAVRVLATPLHLFLLVILLTNLSYYLN